MSIEELLNPRFQIIADFPLNRTKIGTIFLENEIDFEFEKYPHLFKKLNWWDSRSISDMPIYIKSEMQVVKPEWELISWKGREYLQANTNETMFGSHYDLKLFVPATEQEYLDFINKP